MYNNRQSASNQLSNNQLQVLLTGKFGDGCFCGNTGVKLYPNMTYNFSYQTSSIHKNYLEFKKELLGNLCITPVKTIMNTGYKQGVIHTLHTKTSPEITKIALSSSENLLKQMDELGLALWFYDDGSKHKTKEFYNLNTQAFSKEFNEDAIIPFLKTKFDITAILTKDKKKDGKEFWYLRIGKYNGAFIISQILQKYYVNCFDYKLISSETILKWSKLQEQLKSTNTDFTKLSNHALGQLMKKTV